MFDKSRLLDNASGMYSKLFQSMYDGSLAQRGPWEALVTFQQFLILADRLGYVDIHPEVIARRTLIPVEIIRKGIEELEKPDPYSRDPSEGGRRIVRMADHRDWGWRIVNYKKYSSIRSTEDRREEKAALYIASKPTKRQLEEAPGFKEFWALYPRKNARVHAGKAWLKINPDDELRKKILAALLEQKESVQWKKDNGQFVPHAATWLNARRWEDELPAATANPENRNEITCRACNARVTVWTDGMCNPCWEKR